MKIIETLEELKMYYEFNRGVGHTRTLIEGLKNSPDALILIVNPRMREVIGQKSPQTKTATVKSIENGTLRGRTDPLVIDNSALHAILDEALEEIYKLNAEVERWQRRAGHKS